MPKVTESRKVISLEIKIKILDRLRCGTGIAAAGREFNLAESTVRTIKKNEDKIRAAVAAGSSVSLKKTSHARDPDMEKMEKCLCIWVEEKSQKNMPLDGNAIRQKAVRILQHLKANQATSSANQIEFCASKGWFEKFKNRFSLHNVKLQGESASADVEAAKVFPEAFKKIIDVEGYVADQVFNADETGIFWKKMPARTYLSKNEKTAKGFKAAKDRVSLLLCSNASGDFITKPLVIHRALNPRAFKGMDKTKLPVYWRANKRAWMTAVLFKDWFYNLFVPEVEAYMKKKLRLQGSTIN